MRAIKSMQSPVGSFLRFVVGFTVFITVSFGVTYAVNTYTTYKDAQDQTATALHAMLSHK